MRRRGTIALAALVLVGAVLLAPPVPAGAAPRQEPSGETTEDTPVPEQDIIPRPDSGTAPHEAGDRGGALQFAVLAAILAGVGVIVALAVRESRRNRAEAYDSGPYSSQPR